MPSCGPSRPRSATGDGGVLGHQLPFGAVAGEADHDHPTRLDARHHPLTEGGMDDILTQTEGCPRLGDGSDAGRRTRRRSPGALG